MNVRTVIFFVLLITTASACTTTEVTRIRSLDTVSDPTIRSQAGGAVDGLKALTDASENTNIVFVHGIGWTQQRDVKQFGSELILGISKGYANSKIVESKYRCPTTDLSGNPDARPGKTGLIIVPSKRTPVMSTDDPNFAFSVPELGCLDKTVINIGQNKTITVYQFLWDDAMWNWVEWFHMGYDDPIPEKYKNAHAGIDDPDALRASLNSQLKNNVVTYGLTDAALYIGPVGEKMREGVQAAICVAITGSFDRAVAQGATASEEQLCDMAPSSKDALILMSHSLGSRILFDTVTTDRTEKLSNLLSEKVTNKTIELHMFANQIPLIGVGRLGQKRAKAGIAGKSVKLIAYSEINDLLTYELVPYFEQLYYVRCYRSETDGCGSGDSEFSTRSVKFFSDETARQQLISDLGFNVVDIRLRFAPNEIFFYPGLKNASVAHSGHMQVDPVLSVMLCGVEKGKVRMSLADCIKH